MTREEAIRILDPETTGQALAEIEYYNGFSGKTAAVQAVSDACVLAVAALREQEKWRWIPVTERLPEPWKEVITNRTGGHLSIEFKCAGDGWSFDNDIMEEVTHWMPLPEPPKEDKP